ncbi:MAG: hypothetical protein HQK84_02470 [Nitrospinae bacterium]|nr:hypothetical protein [Nitrospinota bacterium]
MRKIVLNGTCLEVDIKNDVTFGEMRAILKDEIENKSLVVTRILGDGEEIFQHRPDECLKSEIGAYKDIEIIAESFEAITERLLTNAAKFLDQLNENVTKISESFRTKSKEEAFEDFILYIDCLQQVFDLLDISQKSNSIKLLESEYKNKRGSDIIKNFASINQEILKAQENKDVVLMADLLEYELSPSIELLSGLFVSRKEALLSE